MIKEQILGRDIYGDTMNISDETDEAYIARMTSTTIIPNLKESPIQFDSSNPIYSMHDRTEKKAAKGLGIHITKNP